MINAKEAYSFATQHIKELVGDYECDLEEIEITPNFKYWIVTLSYYVKKPKTEVQTPIKVIRKISKTITVNSEDGGFYSMKNAKLY
jgi:hypothetical protein